MSSLIPYYCWFLNSNLTKNLKDLKESCRKQNEELQDILIQRDKVQEETITNGEHEDTLVNDSGLEKPAVSTPSKVRDARKSAKKEEVDMGSEDEALHVEDLEPPGVAATKVYIYIFFFHQYSVFSIQICESYSTLNIFLFINPK